MAELGVETILTVLPVFFAQASVPCLQISYSWPSALHEMEISTAQALVDARSPAAAATLAMRRDMAILLQA